MNLNKLKQFLDELFQLIEKFNRKINVKKSGIFICKTKNSILENFHRDIPKVEKSRYLGFLLDNFGRLS